MSYSPRQQVSVDGKNSALFDFPETTILLRNALIESYRRL
ncbi:hypothetical protein C789_666 [Microcystis aeruginosa FACHB-905 = DIANCHI905]|nr:hypothetical protein C789_666 [Microcystis aeruginosa FACHB-905 = DIANCHI905]